MDIQYKIPIDHQTQNNMENTQPIEYGRIISLADTYDYGSISGIIRNPHGAVHFKKNFAEYWSCLWYQYYTTTDNKNFFLNTISPEEIKSSHPEQAKYIIGKIKDLWKSARKTNTLPEHYVIQATFDVFPKEEAHHLYNAGRILENAHRQSLLQYKSIDNIANIQKINDAKKKIEQQEFNNFIKTLSKEKLLNRNSVLAHIKCNKYSEKYLSIKYLTQIEKSKPLKELDQVLLKFFDDVCAELEIFK